MSWRLSAFAAHKVHQLLKILLAAFKALAQWRHTLVAVDDVLHDLGHGFIKHLLPLLGIASLRRACGGYLMA